jgi:hypothetical protein
MTADRDDATTTNRNGSEHVTDADGRVSATGRSPTGRSATSDRIRRVREAQRYAEICSRCGCTIPSGAPIAFDRGYLHVLDGQKPQTSERKQDGRGDHAGSRGRGTSAGISALSPESHRNSPEPPGFYRILEVFLRVQLKDRSGLVIDPGREVYPQAVVQSDSLERHFL